MFQSVDLQSKKLSDYGHIAPEDQIYEIRSLADDLKGARVLHLNATSFGGGVAELLAGLVPLMRDIGLDADWQVMHGAPEFFEVTKSMHNALQGGNVQITPDMQETYLRFSDLNAAEFDQEYDFVIMHDPQPAAIRKMMLSDNKGNHGRWIWRCHIDLTDARKDVWKFLKPYIEVHDVAIFTMESYIKPDLNVPKIVLIQPAIDPVSLKNRDIERSVIVHQMNKHGIDVNQPLIAQISRYDPWKDPLGVIDVHRMLKKDFPSLQLALVATLANDDPEGLLWLEKTARHAGEDPDIHMIYSLVDNSLDVNAFQRMAQVVLQKSKREGFGLVVTEALWKRTPVVAGNVGGIPLQLRDGVDGYLVDSVKEAADKVSYLLNRPDERMRMGAHAQEHVRSKFLITRYLLDYLRLFKQLSEKHR